MDPKTDFSLGGIFCKFLITFLFDLFVSCILFVIAFIILGEMVEVYWDDLVAGFITVPLTTGFVGIFYFEKMLHLLEGISNGTLGEMGVDVDD